MNSEPFPAGFYSFSEFTYKLLPTFYVELWLLIIQFFTFKIFIYQQLQMQIRFYINTCFIINTHICSIGSSVDEKDVWVKVTVTCTAKLIANSLLFISQSVSISFLQFWSSCAVLVRRHMRSICWLDWTVFCWDTVVTWFLQHYRKVPDNQVPLSSQRGHRLNWSNKTSVEKRAQTQQHLATVTVNNFPTWRAFRSQEHSLSREQQLFKWFRTCTHACRNSRGSAMENTNCRFSILESNNNVYGHFWKRRISVFKK